MDVMQKYIKSLRNGNSYEWIANNGHELNKYELIDIVKELDYAIHFFSGTDGTPIYQFAAENLEDTYKEE